MEVINVGLYGGKSIFGGRETPLEASIISCDKHESCSFYKEGHCLNIRGFLADSCQYGSVTTERGYTSRARKYHQFKSKWKNHEKYNKLNRPPEKLGLIDDKIVFPYRFIFIKKEADGELSLQDPYLNKGIAFIDLDKFTVDFIYKICTFKPQAMMGGEIKDFQNKVIPLFLSHLNEVMPNLYQDFIRKYEQFSKPIDYVGRKALLNTIKPSYVEYQSNGYSQFNETWYWDGEFLNYKSGYISKFNIAKDFEIENIKIRPSEKTTIAITDNNQVTGNTVFID